MTTPTPPLTLDFTAQTTLTATSAAPAQAGGEVLVLAATNPAGTSRTDCPDRPTCRVLTDGVDTTGLDVPALESALAALGFTGATGSLVRVPSAVISPQASAPVIAVIGLGAGLQRATDAARDEAALGEGREGVLSLAAGTAVRLLAGTATVVLALPATTADDLAAVARGAATGAYTWSARQPAEQAPVVQVLIPTPLGDDVTAPLLSRARALGAATRLTRDLVNEPPNRLTPAVFADVAAHLAGELPTHAGHLETEVLDDQALRSGGFGGITGVGQGSVHPPRLVRVSWVPAARGGERVKHVGLIGKGITFDSGGLSLKPPASMPEMKSDMAGAATVLATVLACASLEVGVRVDAWLALAENMPTSDAQRPSDIVTMYGGTTVEITNTDAEGRLVMADALARAVEEDLDAVLDVATLTGAQIVALGERVSGVMGTPALRDQVVRSAQRAGEAFWAMPLPEHLRGVLDSPYAALRNSAMGTRAGGMLVAGLFLREFVGATPWAHLDVAGPAFNEKAPWGLTPTGGTGAGVATLLALLEDMTAA